MDYSETSQCKSRGAIAGPTDAWLWLIYALYNLVLHKIGLQVTFKVYQYKSQE